MTIYQSPNMCHLNYFIPIVIVGIAVGFAALAVMILGLIYYFARRQSRARQADEVVLVGDTGTSDA